MSGRRNVHLLRGLLVVWLWQAGLALGSQLWDVPTAPIISLSNHTSMLDWEPPCQSQQVHQEDGAKITALMPPQVEGTWVSTRCEVRPGPEFLTRSYTFYPNRLFKALQHYYADSGCQEPSYSLVIRGKFRLRQASWITPGGTETEHHLHKVGLVLHGPAAVRLLAARLPTNCLGVPSPGRLVPRRLYELYNAKASRDCLGALGFSMMELGLLRVESHQQGAGWLVQKLFLGDMHTDWTQRMLYHPTGYQQPLQNAMYHVHPCPVCGLVYRGSEHHPPVLPPPSSAPSLDLDGRWVSRRCEARPAVLFLTRDFTFHEDHRAWDGVYRHYSDPGCQRPTFTMKASGHYAIGGPAAKVGGATELVFKVTSAKITVQERAILQELNGTRGGSCGQAGGWSLGVEQDVTPTSGCTAMGIKLPHKEYELFKMELDHLGRPLLFTGERPTDGSSPDRPQKRPTSYQAPLVQCGAESNRYSPHVGPSLVLLQSANNEAESSFLHPNLVVMLLLSAWFCLS